MCIRDSAHADVRDAVGRRPEVRMHLAIRTGVARGARADEAVSYTHLRAHETVLDLVCRLLLEKKKN